MGKNVTNNIQLNQYGKKYFKKKWLGVFSVDSHIQKILDNISSGLNYGIINTDKSAGKGIHWVAFIYDTQKNKFFIYDSFGRNSSTLIKTFISNIKKRDSKFKDSKKDAEQRNVEMNCGQRSLAWLMFAQKFGLTKAMKI